MSIGEFLAVFASIILAIGVGDLSMSLHRLLSAGNRVRWDWLSPAAAMFVLLNIVAFWWACYGWYRSAPNLSVVGFLPDIAMFVLLVLSAAAALPDEVPLEGLDLRQFYFGRARYFYGLQVALMALVVADLGPRYARGGWLPVLAAQWDNLAMIGLCLMLIFVRRYWVHALTLALLLSYSCWSYAHFSIANHTTDSRAAATGQLS